MKKEKKRIGVFLWKNDRVLLVEFRGKKFHGLCGLPVGTAKKDSSYREIAKQQLWQHTGLRAEVESFFQLPHEYPGNIIFFSTTVFHPVRSGPLSHGVKDRLRVTRRCKPFWVKVEDLEMYRLSPLAEEVVKNIFGVSRKSKYRLD